MSTPQFRDVSDQEVTYISPAKIDAGLEFIGTYDSSYDGQYGTNYVFFTDTGEKVVWNGCGKLNYLMSKVSPQSLCKIVYLGKKEITTGPMKGKAAHDFQVLTASPTELAVEQDDLVTEAMNIINK